MRSREFINESPELAEKYKAHLIKTLPLLMNFLSKTSKDYVPTEDEMLDVIETGYEVMLQSGDKNKAGEAVRNKLKFLMNKKSVMESLYVDVPNEKWLQDKIDYTKSKGRDKFGAPFFTSTTAYFKQNVRVPIQILRRLPGIEGEQQNVRTKDLIAIKKIMKSTGKLPMHNNKEYVPFIMVAYNGEAWVFNGNHRIMAAAELFDEGDKRFAELPIELRYFDGGERVKSGVLSPEKIGNQNVMEGSYREGGSITHDGVEYDFDSVMSIAEKMPTKTCSVNKLSWVLQYDTPNKERLERADITVPLIVTKSVNGKLAAIDGLHRLAKAVRDNVKTLPVKYVTPKMLSSAKIIKQDMVEGSSNEVDSTFNVTSDNHQFAYHVTPTKNLESIFKQGLKPTLGDRSSKISGEQKGVYLFLDKISAEDAVMNWLGDEFDDEPLTMLEVDITGLDKYISKGADYELVINKTIEPNRIKKVEQSVLEGSENLNYIGNCTDDDVIEHIFGDATNFAQAIEEYGNEFTIGDLVVKYDPETDVHSFYYKKQDVSEVWSEKYKRSINCNNPKGFSQRAHCAGRKKRGKSK